MHANELFSTYTRMYYGKKECSGDDNEGSPVSSVFFWDADDRGSRNNRNSSDIASSSAAFMGCFAIKKVVKEDQFVQDGMWNSIHVVHVDEVRGGKSTYQVTSTILFWMNPKIADLSGSTCLSGTITRQNERTCPVDDGEVSHVANIGTMIEDIENELRSDLDGVYVQRTKETIEDMRPKSSFSSSAMAMHGGNHAMMMKQAMLARNAMKKAAPEDKSS